MNESLEQAGDLGIFQPLAWLLILVSLFSITVLLVVRFGAWERYERGKCWDIQVQSPQYDMYDWTLAEGCVFRVKATKEWVNERGL